MRLLIVFIFASANVLIFSCSATLKTSLLLSYPPIIINIPTPTAVPVAIATAGAAITVVRTPSPELLRPITVTTRALSITLIILIDL